MGLTQIKKAGLDDIALDHVFTIGASGTDHYTFDGEGLNGTVNDPTLYLTRGKTYRFENGTGAHPIRIQSTSGASGTAYNTGVTNNAGSGTVIIEVQHDAPDVLYYQCTSHANMNGILYITGALADGGVTTAKLADDAVTDAKLANSINSAIAANTAKTTNATHTGDVTGSGSLTIASGAVTTAKIADDAVDNSKIADNAVNDASLANNAVTTVNILNGAVTDAKIASGISASKITGLSTDSITEGNSTAEVLDTGSNGIFRFLPEGSEVFRITHEGNVGIGTTSPANKLHLYESTSGSNYIHFSNSSTGISTSDGAQVGIDGNERLIVWQSENNDTRFATNNTERMRILAGGGLTFNGDTAAANALDDYEEGSFTPVYAMSGGGQNLTYHDQQGQYVKIGKFVHCSIHLRVNTVHANGSGIAYIGGLPFQGASNTGQGPGYGTASVGYINGQGGGDWWHGYVEQGQTACYLYNHASSGTSQNVTIASYLYNAGSLRISLSYQVT